MTGTDDQANAGEQLSLLTPGTSAKSAARSARKPPAKPTVVPADADPVARVLVDTGLAHLDRPFDYLVPAGLAQDAVPGARVKVRFAGQDLDGFVVERVAEADHAGRLQPIRRVVSPEPVLTPAVLEAVQRVAERFGGSVGDVLRLAIPPRHARAEQALPAEAEPTPVEDPGPGPWAAYPAGPAFLARLSDGSAPGASWLALPGQTADRDWPVALAHAAAAAHAAGRGTLVVVPDRRDLSRLDRAMRDVLGPGQHVRLDAEQGPQARYTAWLKALRGHVRVAIGTRAAAFAPVRDLGLVAWWDDGDDLHDEPRAPYPHVRDILLARAEVEGAAVLSAGFVRTAAVARLVESGRLRPITAERAQVRQAAPRVRVAGDDHDKERDPAAATAHLPTTAWRAAKEGLTRGPVLLQVPRRGYVPATSCADCRTPARCAHCHGPLSLAGADATPRCRWCDREANAFRCPECDGTRLRARTVGARRTAEEIGRAFPGVAVHTSGAGHVLDEVADAPALVIATPGAEPVARGGYAAALLLDAWALLDRATLDAGEETLRRWTAAAALVRPASDGGAVVLAGVPDHSTLPAVEALVRWDPAWFADRELADRRGLHLPPYAAVASLAGPAAQVRSALDALDRPADALVLGPTADRPDSPDRRAVVLVDETERDALAAALRAVRARRSADKVPAGLQLRMDPRDPGT